MIERFAELIWYAALAGVAAFATFFWFFWTLGKVLSVAGRLFRRRAS